MDTVVSCLFKALKDNKVDYVIQQANAQGVMGSGLAKQWKKEFPGNFHDYRIRYETGQNIMGQFVRTGRVVSIIGQEFYSNRSIRNTNYAALAHGIVSMIEGLWDYPDPIRIGVPHGMGSVLGGGKWENVLVLLNDIEGMFPHVTFVICKR